MISQEKLAKVMRGEAASRPERSLSDLSLMTVPELLTIRASIDALLPAKALGDMDLEEELVIQFMKVKALQEIVLGDGSQTPANQQAQVSNAVAQTLQHLVAMQSKLHTAERLKEIEARLIKALQTVPDEYLEAFFEWYESAETE